ncbi:MAG: ABC transporter permease [Magnetococcales bacterium]|nr:ABC transporter permease [Magnetococcales bacterium]NGZ27578.1 ABC transporter permease [Magnetococcales bacterium]
MWRDGVLWFGFAMALMYEGGIFLLHLILGKAWFNMKTLRRELRMIALEPWGVVSLFAASLGIILAEQGNRMLEFFGSEDYILHALTTALVRDFVPLLVGIFVSARGGVGLAVRLADMSLRREVDALILMDISLLRFLVAPTLIADLVAILLLVVWCDLVGILASGLYLVVQRDLPFLMFLGIVLDGLEFGHLLLSMVKSMTMGVLIVTIAALTGFNVTQHDGGSATVATRTMVRAFLAIVLIQLVFTLLVE